MGETIGALSPPPAAAAAAAVAASEGHGLGTRLPGDHTELTCQHNNRASHALHK